MKNRAFQEMVYRRNASYVQDLLNRISNKDSNALASLYSMTVDEVYKNFYSVLGSAYLAQDGTQALYVLFYRSIGTVKTPSQAAEKLSWLQSQIAARLSMSKKETPARKVQRPALTGREKELLLSELLDSLGLPDNSIPLEYIQEYDIYRGRRTSTMRWIIAIAALVLIAVPLLFLNPDVKVEKSQSSNKYTGLPSYSLEVSSMMPVRSVVATVTNKEGSQAVPVMQENENTYTLLPRTDGKMTVTVKTAGRGIRKSSVKVRSFDTWPPVLVSTSSKDGHLILHLSDKGSGVDFSRITAEDEEGNKVDVLSSDSENNTVTFDYPEKSSIELELLSISLTSETRSDAQAFSAASMFISLARAKNARETALTRENISRAINISINIGPQLRLLSFCPPGKKDLLITDNSPKS